MNVEAILYITLCSLTINFYFTYINQYYKLFDCILFDYSCLLEYNKMNLFSFPKQNFSVKPKPYNKCKLCSFVPNNGSHLPNSSIRDAIFLLGINKLTNLLPIVKTLRTTGSRCRIFLFTDDKTLSKYKKLHKFYQTLENCGLEFVNLGNMDSSDLFFICLLKYNIYKSFLIQYHQFFDRIIFMDLYDSIIQHDPFTTEFGNSLYLSDEGYIIRDNSFNLYYVEDGFKKLTKFNFTNFQKQLVINGSILNGGLQQGSIFDLIKLCSIMEESGNIRERVVYTLDQSFLNIIVYSGYLSKKMNFKILPKGNDLSSTIGLYVQEMMKDKVTIVFGNISRDGKIPAILHQYDRYYKIKDELRRVCPNDENFTDYLR